MKIQKVPNKNFPGRNRGLITVLIRNVGHEGHVQLSLDLFEKNPLKNK